MRDWCDEEGGVDEAGIYHMSRANPVGNWDL
jgi:hypothetical protein